MRRALRHAGSVARVLLALLPLLAQAGSAVDDRGLRLQLESPPQRIVSLLPSLAESVCALDRCEALVGVDDWTNWPQSLRSLPRLGGLDDANLERIVALRPDVVLLAGSSRVSARLEQLGLRVFELEPRTSAQVHGAIERLGALLGREAQALALSARIRQEVQQAAASVPPAARGLRVYFEVASGPYAAGPRSHIGELLDALGASNIVPASLGSVPRLNPEFVVRADPQLLILDAREAADLGSRPGWRRMRALREHRICALDKTQGDVVARPGPRLGEAARVLARCLEQAVVER